MDMMAQHLTNNTNPYSDMYDKYAPAMYSVILKLIPNRQVADAILQKSFIKILKEYHSYNDTQGTLFSFMLKITLQECKKEVELPKNIVSILMLNRPQMYTP